MLGTPLQALLGLSGKVSVLRLEYYVSPLIPSWAEFLQEAILLDSLPLLQLWQYLGIGVAASVYTKTMVDAFVNLCSLTMVELSRGLWCFVNISF